MCLSGTTYLVTRTCANRRFFMRPDPVVNQVFAYCLARAMRGRRIEVHAVSVESNHFHIVLTDHDGSLPKFMQVLDRLIAVCLMEHYRELRPTEHLEGIWSKDHYSATALLNEAAVLNAIAYTLTNPVKDALVVDYRKWPGFNSRPSDWRKPTRYADRPELFFNQDDRDWAEAAYRFTVPPMMRDRDLDQVIEDVERLVHQEHSAHRTAVAADGRGFMGVAAVLAVDPFSSPNTIRPKGTLNPQLAAGGDRKLLQEGKKLLRGFRERYREAWKSLCAGARPLFPAGTYWLRTQLHVECDPLDAPWCAAALAPS